MAIEIQLLKIYKTPKGKLRAKVKYCNKIHTLKINKDTSSCISMPIGFTSFFVQEISNTEINQSVSIQLVKPNQNKELVRLDFISSQFI